MMIPEKTWFTETFWKSEAKF